MYQSDVIGTLCVPRGFRTDFASVPRLPVAYLLAGGKANAAAVVHDWMYSTRIWPRKMAYDVFYERHPGARPWAAYRLADVGWGEGRRGLCLGRRERAAGRSGPAQGLIRVAVVSSGARLGFFPRGHWFFALLDRIGAPPRHSRPIGGGLD